MTSSKPCTMNWLFFLVLCFCFLFSEYVVSSGKIIFEICVPSFSLQDSVG